MIVGTKHNFSNTDGRSAELNIKQGTKNNTLSPRVMVFNVRIIWKFICNYPYYSNKLIMIQLRKIREVIDAKTKSSKLEKKVEPSALIFLMLKKCSQMIDVMEKEGDRIECNRCNDAPIFVMKTYLRKWISTIIIQQLKLVKKQN